MSVNEFSGANYGRVAGIYERLEWLNAGYLAKARNAFLGRLPFAPEDPIVVGCGPGSFVEAYVRSERPSRMTVNDIAPEMLARAVKRLQRTEWRGELASLPGEITALGLARTYDFLAAQFFLDCFPQAARVRMLGELAKLVKPGGILLISDYSPPPSRWMRPFYYFNYGVALMAFWALVQHAPNRPGDIEQAIMESGLRIAAKRSFGLGMFTSWLIRVDASDSAL